VRNTAKGHVDLLILAALDNGPAHGYALVDTLRDQSDGVFDLAEGTVYPALYRLERQGLVTSSWEEGRTRRRRVYRLTRSGTAQLQVDRDSWRRHVRAMQAVLG
jgi:PadR family transcriptional regulator PadR